jgi:hypothetical protein
VVLPAPLGPKIVRKLPKGTSKFIPFRASIWPKERLRFSTFMAHLFSIAKPIVIKNPLIVPIIFESI